jgi:putative PIN family toxin of toxin-antitoxin system
MYLTLSHESPARYERPHAAFITRGVCHELLEHCLRQHTVVSSEFILSEFQEHLVEKFKFTSAQTKEAIDLMRIKTQVVGPAKLDVPTARDPDDDIVLGTAKAGAVNCLVTGDKDLLTLKQFDGIDIIAPSEFAAYEASK